MPVPFDGDDIMFALFVLISLIIAFFVHLSQIGKNKVATYSFFIVWIVIPISSYLLFNLSREKQHRLIMHKQQEAEQKLKAFLDVSTPYFKEKCKEAGIFIYDKNISSQDSIYIIPPSKEESFLLPRREANRNNQQYVVHGFDHKISKEDDYISFVHAYNYLVYAPGFSYVETYLGEPENLVRFEEVPFPTKYSSTHTKFAHTPISSISSRYGSIWEDISTKEDRDHWVAGGKLQIIDFQAKKVVAEAIDYVMANNPDIYDWNRVNTCPEKYDPNKFIWSVLRSKEYFDYMQDKKIRKK